MITNGSAVLGLGNIGRSPAPVMEGKGCLFKKFAGIDVFDIEVDESDPDKLVEIAPAWSRPSAESTWRTSRPRMLLHRAGATERMKIPVFHDDQHGTAIIAAAAVLNGLELVGKNISNVKIACSGAGAAAIACLDQLVSLGVRWKTSSSPMRKVSCSRAAPKEWTRSRRAMRGRLPRAPWRHRGADIFRTVGRRRAQAGHGQAHGEGPADPGIGQPTRRSCRKKPRRCVPMPSSRRAALTIQTRSTMSCAFLFMRRLDVGATTINEAMKSAAVRAIASLAHAEVSDVVATAYGDQRLQFGPEYLIPTRSIRA